MGQIASRLKVATNTASRFLETNGNGVVSPAGRVGRAGGQGRERGCVRDLIRRRGRSTGPAWDLAAAAGRELTPDMD